MTDQADQPDTRPISPLRQRMLEDMAISLCDATQRDYLRPGSCGWPGPDGPTTVRGEGPRMAARREIGATTG